MTSDGIDLCKWRIGDEGRVLVQEKLGDEDESLSARTKRTLPLRYYEWLGENRKNGDITIPIWPDCRMSAEEEADVAEQLFRVENAESE